MSVQPVFVDLSETYDINTVKDKLNLYAIHTPTSDVIDRNLHGLNLNFKYCRIMSCDIGIASATPLPMDPLGVGTEPGAIAPQEVFNPLLFKACTGESLNRIMNVIYRGGIAESDSVDKSSVSTSQDEDIFYALMSDDTFRKAHPSQGMFINDLVPMVHELVAVRPLGENSIASPPLAGGPKDDYNAPATGDNLNTLANGVPIQLMTERPVPMPAFPTMNIIHGTDGAPTNNVVNPNVPKVYVGALVLPPAILHSWYFRVQITWHLVFSGFRSSNEVTTDAHGNVHLGGWSNVYHNIIDVPVTPEGQPITMAEPTKEYSSIDTFDDTASVEPRMAKLAV